MRFGPAVDIPLGRRPAVGLPTRQGFGARVMERIIQGQLKGELKLDWREDAVGCEITLDT